MKAEERGGNEKGNGIFNTAPGARGQSCFWRFVRVLSCRLLSFTKGRLGYAMYLELPLLTLN